MLVNAKYAEQLLRRRKITAAARAAFTFPTEDILDPITLGPIVNEAVEMSRSLARRGTCEIRWRRFAEKGPPPVACARDYPAAEGSGSLITSTSPNSLTFRLRSLPNT